MFKSKIQLLLLAMIAFLPAIPTAFAATAAPQASCATTCLEDDPRTNLLTPQRLHRIFTEAVEYWPNGYPCTYGELRSGYNHGTVIVELAEEAQVLPGQLAFNVYYEGILLCVVIDA